MRLFALFRDKPYESQVILLISILGVVRMVIALVIDFARVVVHPMEIITDLVLFSLFLGLLLVGVRKMRIKTINPVFGFGLTALLALNFLQFNGLFDNARFNFLLGFYVLGLLYSGKWLLAHLITHSVIGVVISYLNIYRPHTIEFFSLGIAPSPTEFWFAILASAVLMFYLKTITKAEIDKNEQLLGRLAKNVARAQELNEELIRQADALRGAHEQLEREVLKKTEALKRQQESIEQYTLLHTSVLNTPLTELTTAVNGLPDTAPLAPLAKASQYELQAVFEAIRDTLTAREQLIRTKVAKNERAA